MNPILSRIDKKYLEKYKEMFSLAEMLEDASLPFFFNVLDDLRPTPFGQERPEDMDLENYVLRIEVGREMVPCLSEISIIMSTGENKELLELLDMRPLSGIIDLVELKAEDGRLTKDMTAQQCFEVIKKHYE